MAAQRKEPHAGRRKLASSMPSPDEIYERYLARAIREMNTLGDEISSCARVTHPALAPVLGSGHPLADVMLLKYRAQAPEIQEGVAFFGRAGAAVLKSVKRLAIDPLRHLRHELRKVRRRAAGRGRERLPALAAARDRDHRAEDHRRDG